MMGVEFVMAAKESCSKGRFRQKRRGAANGRVCGRRGWQQREGFAVEEAGSKGRFCGKQGRVGGKEKGSNPS